MPGMIEGHWHLFLHPYNETMWDDQVLHEPLALRTARAVVQARRTLEAGFTTERDLGTEGAGFADVGPQAGDRPGHRPRPAPARLDQGDRRPRRLWSQGLRARRPGAARRTGGRGVDEIVKAVRDQVAAGADIVKFYADYHWGKGEPSRPTLSQAETERRSRRRARRRAPRRRPRDHRRGHAPRDPRRRRHDRARLRRDRRRVQADARPAHRPVPDDRGVRSVRALLPGLERCRSPRPRASRRTAVRSSWR